MPKLAVLVSGVGSVLEAILSYPLQVDLVVADRPCRALQVAKDAEVASVLVRREDFSPAFSVEARRRLTSSVYEALTEHGIDIVAMAGFMTVLDASLFRDFHGPILNTHPSLLPAFKGANAVREALEYGVQWTGCTVHVATAALDEGPIIVQCPVEIFKDDTVATLHERIKEAERRVYPEAIGQVLARCG